MPSKFADCKTVNNVLVKLACHFSETGQVRNFDLSTILEAENQIAALTVEREPEDEGQSQSDAEKEAEDFDLWSKCLDGLGHVWKYYGDDCRCQRCGAIEH